MQAIELDAGVRFAEIGMQSIAEAEPAPPDVLSPPIDEGRAWMAADHDGTSLGYLFASIVDGHGHIDQVSTTIAAAGRGVGRDLIETAVEWARAQGSAAVTLTTFRDVAFNAPLYERYGFAEMGPHDLGAELAAIRQGEIADGLDVSPRVAMIRHVASPA